jgi:hypothetical protein
MTTGNAVIADVFAPHERGRAMGIAAIPLLVRPPRARARARARGGRLLFWPSTAAAEAAGAGGRDGSSRAAASFPCGCVWAVHVAGPM